MPFRRSQGTVIVVARDALQAGAGRYRHLDRGRSKEGRPCKITTESIPLRFDGW